MKRLLIAVLLSVVSSSLVSAQTPTSGRPVQSTNERVQAESAKPSPDAGKSTQSRPSVAPSLPIIKSPEDVDMSVSPLPDPAAADDARPTGVRLTGGRARIWSKEDVPKDDKEFYARGVFFLARQQYDLAIADFDKAIQLNPQHTNAYLKRGKSYVLKGNYKRGIADYDKLIQVNPQHALAYADRGLAYYHKGDQKRALSDFDKAIQIDPQLSIAYNNRGLAYSRKGDFDRAIADFDKAIEPFDKAIELGTWNASAYYNNRGTAYRDKGDYARAIADYSEAIRLRPGLIQAYTNRAIAYQKIGDEAKAQSDLDKAAELERQARNR